MKLFRLAIPCLALGLTGVNVQAAVWNEVGNSHSLPGTAENTTGVNPLTAITGSLTGNPDADMYRIYIPTPTLFSATTVGGATFDTQLFLFDSAGFGVLANDDTASPLSLRSTLPTGNALVGAGYYFLLITAFDRDPTSSTGLIFPNSPTTGVYGPTGPGGANPITGYSGTGISGNNAYTITLTGADFAPSSVPEPMSITLLGGVACLAGYAFRRKSQRSV